MAYAALAVQNKISAQQPTNVTINVLGEHYE